MKFKMSSEYLSTNYRRRALEFVDFRAWRDGFNCRRADLTEETDISESMAFIITKTKWAPSLVNSFSPSGPSILMDFANEAPVIFSYNFAAWRAVLRRGQFLGAPTDGLCVSSKLKHRSLNSVRVFISDDGCTSCSVRSRCASCTTNPNRLDESFCSASKNIRSIDSSDFS